MTRTRCRRRLAGATITDGTFPDMRAIRRPRMLEAWFAAGGRADARREDGMTVALAAAFAMDPESLDIALRHGCDPDAVDEHGWSIAYIAARDGRKAVLDVAIGHGCRVDIPTANGWNAAFAAACGNHHACLATALHHGCRVDTVDPDGMTVADVAVEHRSLASLTIAIGAGAEPPAAIFATDHDAAWLGRPQRTAGSRFEILAAALSGTWTGARPTVEDVPWFMALVSRHPDAPWALRMLAKLAADDVVGARP